MRRLVVLLILSVWNTDLTSSEVRPIFGLNANISVSGEIIRGDYRKVADLIMKQGKMPRSLSIGSPGGDVMEAIKIGRLVRSGLIEVNPGKQCNSACALIFFASIDHDPATDMNTARTKVLGIHRPYFDKRYFAGLSMEEAAKEYKRLEQEVISYLYEMKVPTSVIEQMMTVPSDRVVSLSIKDYRELAGDMPPAFEEWLKARCPAGLTETEEKDNQDSITLGLHNFALKEGDIEMAKFTEAIAQRARCMSQGYRDYLWNKGGEHGRCRTNAIIAAQEQYFNKLKRELGAK